MEESYAGIGRLSSESCLRILWRKIIKWAFHWLQNLLRNTSLNRQKVWKKSRKYLIFYLQWREVQSLFQVIWQHQSITLSTRSSTNYLNKRRKNEQRRTHKTCPWTKKDALEKMQKRNKSMFVGLLFNDIWTLILTIVLIWVVLKWVGFLWEKIS